MPRVRPLTPQQAKRTLANRLGPRVDRLRQIATNLGVRPYRVYLTWVSWSGGARGEGEESIFKRIEILPTPRVTNVETQSLTPFSAGVLPIGQIRVDLISVAFTEDRLSGRNSGENEIPDNLDFFYELQEDGRGDDPAYRHKFRLATQPYRKAGGVQWIVLLERIGGSDLDRDGTIPEPEC